MTQEMDTSQQSLFRRYFDADEIDLILDSLRKAEDGYKEALKRSPAAWVADLVAESIADTTKLIAELEAWQDEDWRQKMQRRDARIAGSDGRN